jgi:OOP family OmpA-OmpF porin
MFKRTILTLFFSVCLTASSWAAIQPGAFTLSPMFGGQFFDGRQALADTDIWSIGLGYNLDENWAIEAIYSRTNTPAEAENSSSVDTDLESYRIDGLYHLMPSSHFVPYLAAGLGVMSYDRDGAKDEDNLILNYGVGVKWFILDDLIALRGDVRHLYDSDDNAHNLVTSAGLFFQLGKAKPAPQPIAEPAPAPVMKIEPVKPLDSDMDGVIDSRDKCPNTPAGVSVDTYGCPLDTDNDGVADYLDKCPNTPAGAPVDTDGCPLDSDKDGVFDYLDKCPGTPAGYSVDAKGCPFTMTLHINFATNSSAITPAFIGEVEKAAECVRDFPGNHVLIEGHTDSQGAAAYNQMLSEKRAESVKQSLIEQFNIPAEKLSSIGYGEEMPVADNATADGRALNRRVEVGCAP